MNSTNEREGISARWCMRNKERSSPFPRRIFRAGRESRGGRGAGAGGEKETRLTENLEVRLHCRQLLHSLQAPLHRCSASQTQRLEVLVCRGYCIN